METTSQQRWIQYEQKATSTLKMQDKLSSNSAIRPAFLDDQITLLKLI